MSQIRIEGKPVSLGVETFFDHLYLVFVDDSGAEFVLRGGPTNNNPLDFGAISVELGLPIALSEDNRPIEDRDEHGSRVLELNVGDAAAAWQTLLNHANEIALAELPYSATGQNSNSFVSSLLYVIGLDVADWLPDTPGIDDYPATSNVLDSISFNLVGGFGDFETNSDLLRGGQSNDWLFGGGGNDYLTDGSGADVLEGAKGDDIVELSSDSSADIVIVGEGNDFIVGGGSEDRIVLRGTNFGGGDDTQGLALLGGFLMSGGAEAAFETQQMTTMSWEQWKIMLGDPDAEQGDIQDEWDVTATVQQWPFLQDLGDEPGRFINYYLFEGEGESQDLGVVYSFFDMSTEVWSSGTVIVQDFQAGDFGIQFFGLTHIDGVRGQLGGTSSVDIVTDSAGFDHIWNSGQLLTLPEAPDTSEPQQQRFSPQHSVSPSIAATSSESGHLQLSNDRRPIYVDTAVQAYDGGPHLRDSTGTSPWSAAYLGDDSANLAYDLEEAREGSHWLDAGFGEFQADALGEAWYEPEPIGGLV
jgi:hypothetical protein